MFPLPRLGVWSLVKKLKSHRQWGQRKKKVDYFAGLLLVWRWERIIGLKALMKPEGLLEFIIEFKPSKPCLIYLLFSFLFFHMNVCACVASCFSRIWVFVTLWTVAYQAPQSTGFSRQEYRSRVAMPSSRGSSWPMAPVSPGLQANSLSTEPSGKPLPYVFPQLLSSTSFQRMYMWIPFYSAFLKWFRVGGGGNTEILWSRSTKF